MLNYVRYKTAYFQANQDDYFKIFEQIKLQIGEKIDVSEKHAAGSGKD